MAGGVCIGDCNLENYKRCIITWCPGEKWLTYTYRNTLAVRERKGTGTTRSAFFSFLLVNMECD